MQKKAAPKPGSFFKGLRKFFGSPPALKADALAEDARAARQFRMGLPVGKIDETRIPKPNATGWLSPPPNRVQRILARSKSRKA